MRILVKRCHKSSNDFDMICNYSALTALVKGSTHGTLSMQIREAWPYHLEVALP